VSAGVGRRRVSDMGLGAWIEGVGWVDCAWVEGGLPACRWDRAPAGLVTRRQLRELGLCPGGNPPVAVLRRRPGGRLHAWLYRLDLARDKRVATAAVLVALSAAMRARRSCPSCGRDTGCCVPRSLGQCWDCHLLAPARVAADHDRTPHRALTVVVPWGASRGVGGAR
jgi:hypothetical protein